MCIHTHYGRPVWLATELVYNSLRGAPNLPPGRQPTSHLHVVQCHRYTVEPHFPVLATRACLCYFSEENPAMDIGQEIFLKEQEADNMYRFPATYTLNPQPWQLHTNHSYPFHHVCYMFCVQPGEQCEKISCYVFIKKLHHLVCARWVFWSLTLGCM
jgi:hypothetical protein